MTFQYPTIVTQLYFLTIVIKNSCYHIVKIITLTCFLHVQLNEILPTTLPIKFIPFKIYPSNWVFIILLLIIQLIALVILNILLNRLIVYGVILVHYRLQIYFILLSTFCLNVFINLGVSYRLSKRFSWIHHWSVINVK